MGIQYDFWCDPSLRSLVVFVSALPDSELCRGGASIFLLGTTVCINGRDVL